MCTDDVTSDGDALVEFHGKAFHEVTLEELDDQIEQRRRQRSRHRLPVHRRRLAVPHWLKTAHAHNVERADIS